MTRLALPAPLLPPATALRTLPVILAFRDAFRRQLPRFARAVRPCRSCDGAGETIFNSSWNQDPQCDVPVRCADCAGSGEVLQVTPCEPLVTMGWHRRNRALRSLYVNARRRAMKPVYLP